MIDNESYETYFLWFSLTADNFMMVDVNETWMFMSAE